MPIEMQHLKDIECQLEIKLSFVNEYVREIYNLAKRYNKIIVISSDMYLPLAVIS